MKDNKSASLFPKEQVIESLKQSFVKLNPRIMIKNPIMFTVEVATVVMLLVTLYSIVNSSQGSFAYNIAVFIILFVTLLFANFAEAIAEGRGKAQADSLRAAKKDVEAHKIESLSNKEEFVDIFLYQQKKYHLYFYKKLYSLFFLEYSHCHTPFHLPV